MHFRSDNEYWLRYEVAIGQSFGIIQRWAPINSESEN